MKIAWGWNKICKLQWASSILRKIAKCEDMLLKQCRLADIRIAGLFSESNVSHIFCDIGNK